MGIEAPWGLDGSLPLEFPDEWRVGDAAVVEPDLSGSVEDYSGALGRALDAPLKTGRLEDLVRGGSKVALIVDDPSRWTPVREALPSVLKRLHGAGVAADDVTISVGVGRHQAVDDVAMKRRLGDDVAARYRCFSPPVDDLSAYDELGTTSQGVPVRIFRPVVEADLRILIGSVLPHLQAGFGGGYKLILPGTSHRETLGALHRQGLGRGSDAGRLLGGEASANPMRAAIHEAARMLGPCFSISHLIGSPGAIFQVAAGRPEAVQDLLADEARERFEAPPAPPADVVVVGNHPWPGDPMQSFKVLLHHRSASRPNGVAVGLFWTDPEEIERSLPRSATRLIAGSGAPGGWAIRRLVPMAERLAMAANSPASFMLRWARELVIDRTVLVYSPPLHARIGGRLGPVRLFANQTELWRAARKALPRNRRDQPSVRVFPRGGLTYVPQRERSS